jgi:hypothetical protein
VTEQHSGAVRSVAYHKAGHVVVAHHFGRPIGRAWIDPKTRSGGSEISGRRECDESMPADAREIQLIAMAGSAAQCCFLGKPPEWVLPYGEDDMHAAVDCEEASGMAGNDFTIISTLLERPDIWARVVRVGETLCERIRLSPDEILVTLDSGAVAR